MLDYFDVLSAQDQIADRTLQAPKVGTPGTEWVRCSGPLKKTFVWEHFD